MQGLLSVIRGVSFMGELLLEPDMEWPFLANIDYICGPREYIARLREYIQSLVDR